MEPSRVLQALHLVAVALHPKAGGEEQKAAPTAERGMDTLLVTALGGTLVVVSFAGGEDGAGGGADGGGGMDTLLVTALGGTLVVVSFSRGRCRTPVAGADGGAGMDTLLVTALGGTLPVVSLGGTLLVLSLRGGDLAIGGLATLDPPCPWVGALAVSSLAWTIPAPGLAFNEILTVSFFKGTEEVFVVGLGGLGTFSGSSLMILLLPCRGNPPLPLQSKPPQDPCVNVLSETRGLTITLLREKKIHAEHAERFSRISGCHFPKTDLD